MSLPNWYEVILSWLGDVSLANNSVVISQLEARFITRLAGGGHAIPKGDVADRLRVKGARKDFVPYCRAVLADVEAVADGDRVDMSLTRDSALALVALACSPSLYERVTNAGD